MRAADLNISLHT
jgi:hypothetical protein